jgi:hypothetical protein
MMNNSHYLEEIWDDILSRHPARIKRRYDLLDTNSREEVIQHLNRMVSEEGWQEPQVISARAALAALNSKDAAGND